MCYYLNVQFQGQRVKPLAWASAIPRPVVGFLSQKWQIYVDFVQVFRIHVSLILLLSKHFTVTNRQRDNIRDENKDVQLLRILAAFAELQKSFSSFANALESIML